MENEKSGAREKILNAAEELFAYGGLNGVSVRDITTKAGVRLASVNYYFETKEGLYLAVLLRRVNVLTDQRLELLLAIDTDALSTEQALERFVHAFVYPLLERNLEGGVGWRNYTRLVAMAAAMQVASAPLKSRQTFDEAALKFNEVLKKILPDISERNCFYAYQFMVGCTQYTFLQGSRLNNLSRGKYSSSDLDQICAELIPFIASGLRALENSH